MATTLHTQVVLDAMNMAVTQRQPRSVVHHSDHGCQYTSIAFGQRCKEAGVQPSMGTVGDPYDLEGFYNPRRRHSALDHLSPIEDEAVHATAA